MTYFTFSAEILRSEPGGHSVINTIDAEMSKKQAPLRICDVSQKYALAGDDPAEDEAYWVEFSLPDFADSTEPIFEFAPALGVDPAELAELCDEMIDCFYDAHNDN